MKLINLSGVESFSFDSKINASEIENEILADNYIADLDLKSSSLRYTEN